MEQRTETKMLFRFRKFPVYQKAREFRKEILKLIEKKFSKREFALKDQIKRALNSICLNIAEGSNRSSDKDFAHFINNSLSSVEEVVSGLDLAFDDKYINKEELEHYSRKAEFLGKQLIGFEKSLRK